MAEDKLMIFDACRAEEENDVRFQEFIQSVKETQKDRNVLVVANLGLWNGSATANT